MHAQGLASSSSTAQPFGWSLRTGRTVREGEFLQACPNGDPREPSRLGHAAHASSSHGAGFDRCPHAASALIQERPQNEKLCCNRLACWVLHRANRNTLRREMDILFWRDPLETGTYECSGVVKNDDGTRSRGYKLATLRTLLDRA